MISLDKCNGSCNVLKIQKYDINIKAFTMIASKYEAKTMTNTNSCYCKWKFSSTTCNSDQNLNNNTCQCESKIYHACKKDYSWNPRICIYENNKYLKSFFDASLTECDEIITVMDNLWTKQTNAVATNVASTASINYFNKLIL